MNTLVKADESFLAGALRETNEEVGVPPEQIEILGQIGPPELSLGGMRVWPYVVCALLQSHGVGSIIPTGVHSRICSMVIRRFPS
jgi:8-oxo-dGTP pyrophosphatase MutT (NUDIX family)